MLLPGLVLLLLLLLVVLSQDSRRTAWA